MGRWRKEEGVDRKGNQGRRERKGSGEVSKKRS